MTEQQKTPCANESETNRWLTRLVLLLCLISCALCATLTYRHYAYEHSIYRTKKTELKRLTVDATRQIAAVLRQVMNTVDTLADGLTQGTIDKRNMRARIRAVLAANPNYYGCGIAFSPYGYDKKIRLYAPYYSHSGPGGKLTYQQIGKIYDYTTSQYDWYTGPMAKGNRWGEPYWDAAGRTYMITYSALFYRTDPRTHKKVPDGIVGVDISMNRIKEIIESLNIGPSGFGALTTRDGYYLYHPDHQYVQKHMNIRDVARLRHDHDRLLMAAMAAKGKGGIIDHISTTTGEDSWLVFEPVPIAGWSLQNTFIKNDLNIDIDALRRQIIGILITAILFIGSLSFLLLRVNLGRPDKVWIFTGIVSVLLVLGIGIIWHLALTYHSTDRRQGVEVADKATLKVQELHYREASRKRDLPPPIFIPTGLYIDAMGFTSTKDLRITGRIWQRYPDDYPAKLAKGIQFGRADGVKLTKTNVQKVAGGEVIQWTFQADMRVKLDYSRYPLEVEQLPIQLLPPDIDGNTVLVPDLDAYKLTSPTLLPGLAHNVFIPGWKLTKSFFVLRKQDRGTNFGVERNFDRDRLPTLYYTVEIKRDFIDAFISNLTPLIVVAIVLFALTLLSSTLDISKTLGVCVSVFFVVVFSHLSIRKSIAAGEIFYLEYIYFVIYLVLILVPINSFRIALGLRSRFFEYRNGLLANALYWPFVLGTFFVITAMKFY